MSDSIVIATRTNTNDVLTMLIAVQKVMNDTDQSPDIPAYTTCADPEKDWYDPRRPLATDVWRAVAGLSLKYHGAVVPKEVEEHAEHGRKFFGGHPCLCPVCVGHRVKMDKVCPACQGTRKVVEDHDGRAGYSPCKECA
jgi:hypothetical protein